MNKNIDILISKEELEVRVLELAKEIERDYQDKDLVCIGLLKGSVIFMSDLIKNIDLELSIDFMKVSSYGSGTSTSGIVKILKDIDHDISGKDVLLIEDIVDSGLTLSNVKEFILKKQPNSVKICTLLDKPERRQVEVYTDYVGFQIPDEFVVGYGLDYAEKFRNIPFVGKFNLEEK